MTTESQFGHQLLPLFDLDETYVNVNHGSYGSIPKLVKEAKFKSIQEIERNPDKWFRIEAEKQFAELRQLTAEYVQADPDTLVFVDNASDGVNSVLRSIKYNKGDIILLTNISYQMVVQVCEFLKQQFEIVIEEVVFDKENILTPESVIEVYRQKLETLKGKNVVIGVVDHLVSVPSVLFPIQQISQLVHEQNIQILVDGAHVVGQFDLDIKSYQVDYYTSNFHKWFYGAKNTAFLYIDPQHTQSVHPTIIGNFFGQGQQREFYWRGTRDFSSFVALRASQQFRDIFGEKDIQEYMHNLAIQAGKTTSQILGTEVLLNDDKLYGSMVTVRIPDTDLATAFQANDELFKQCGTFMALFQFSGHVWWRISCQIYNEISDYVQILKEFLPILENLKKQQN